MVSNNPRDAKQTDTKMPTSIISLSKHMLDKSNLILVTLHCYLAMCEVYKNDGLVEQFKDFCRKIKSFLIGKAAMQCNAMKNACLLSGTWLIVQDFHCFVK